jgi:glycosyltransferase involved in cell wall biosynthesis
MSAGGDRGRINVHIYPSPFRFESRMLKETATAVASGGFDHVFILARWEPGLDKTESIDEHRTVLRLATPLGSRLPGVLGTLVSLLEWQLRAGLWMIRRGPAVVNPHSLPVLPVAVLIRLLRRSRIIYDTHELETHSINASPLRRVVGGAIEMVAIPLCSAVVVVGHAIGEWYSTHRRGARVIVVRNVPHRSTQPPEPNDRLRRRFEIAEDHFLFLYQGSINRGRSVELLLDVFADLPPDRHVVFLGYGELEQLVRDAAEVHPNIHFHEAVPPTELLALTAGADVGICLIENACLSYYLSLPNKLFEYISAGVPVLASDFPEMRRLLEELEAGWLVAVDRDAVVASLLEVDDSALSSRRDAALAGRATLDWDTEAAPLHQLYRELADT